MRILLAEGSDRVRAYLSSLLTSWGHAVVEASDGNRALLEYRRLHPDLVMLDAEISAAGDHSVVEMIRSTAPERWVPVVLLGSRRDGAGIAAGIDAGGDDYLSKPVDTLVLRAKIRAIERTARVFTPGRDSAHDAAPGGADVTTTQSAAADRADAHDDRTNASSRTQSSFLANVSHELRTPLHAVLSFSELGYRRATQTDASDLRRYFDRIRSSGRRLMALIDAVLDLSALETGQVGFRFESQDIQVLCRDVVGELDPMLREKRIAVDWQVDGIVPPCHFDAASIAQVLRNVVGNAVRFSPEDRRVRIAIAACHLTGHLGSSRGLGPGVLLRIADQGIGIPRGEHERIFEKFAQSTRTGTGAGGTGLGLAICREIVRAHAGTIHAEPNADGGTTIVIALPAGAR